MVAQVIVDVVHTNVAKPFSYRIPDGMEVCVGLRVLVPLGRRQVDGFVVDIVDESQIDLPPEKLRPIAKALDDYPALLPQLLELAEELSLECHCPLSETLRLMLPAAMRTGRIHAIRQLCKLLLLELNAPGAHGRRQHQPERLGQRTVALQ